MASQHQAERDLLLIRGQVLPRWRSIITSPALIGAVIAGVGLTVVLPFMPASITPITTATSIGFTFAAISMGACFTAMVLVLGLPGEERLKTWARLPSTSHANKSQLSELFFAILWAALAQLLLILVCVAASVLGGELPIAPSAMSPSHGVGLALGLIALFYAIAELFVVVQTLLQISVVIIFEEENKKA